MKTTPLSETEARKLAARRLLRPGMYEGTITAAVDAVSKANNEMLVLDVSIIDSGDTRILRDWLTNTKISAAKLRHAAEAVGALAQYEAGELSPDDFLGRAVRVKVGVEKRRSYPDRNAIEDYAATVNSSVVNLRSAG
jgi:hypothetical protein